MGIDCAKQTLFPFSIIENVSQSLNFPILFKSSLAKETFDKEKIIDKKIVINFNFFKGMD